MALRILIADDNEGVRTALSDFLRGSGDNWEICCEAEDGRAAIQKAAEMRPDVVVLDLLMPNANGLTAAREIHSRVPSACILMFTQIDASIVAKQAREAGIEAVVPKTNVQALLGAIRQAASHQHRTKT